MAQNPNANALRWGTLYNYRFDSNSPPTTMNAVVGFYKTGSPITVQVQAPSATCTPLTFASAVSRKNHGTAGTFDIPLPLSGAPGIENRSGGAGNEHTLVFTFSNNVVSGSANVTSGAGTASAPVFSGNTMTVNLSGVTDEQLLAVTLSNVTDQNAQTMPDTAVSVKMLIGDSNGSSGVSAADVGQTKSRAGAALDESTFRSDINANGSINVGDVAQVKATVGHSL